MTKAEKAQLLKAILHLAAAFDATLSQERQTIYLENLSKIPYPVIAGAIQRCMDTCKFFPSIAEIRELAGQGDNKQALEDRAALAWDNLRSLRGKAYRESALECPITAKCFRALGGKMNFGTWDYDAQEQWKRKEFISLYTAYARDSRITQEFDQVESQGILQQITNHGVQRPA